MGNKLILSIGASMILVSSLLAFGGHSGKKNGSHKGGVIKMVMNLDLSDTQRTQIRTIMQDGKASMPNPSNAFSDTSFDEAKFIKLLNERKNNKIEHMAKRISKIYKVLSVEQKKNLRTMLDAKNKMRQKNKRGKQHMGDEMEQHNMYEK
jgi:Spy/CpxP family protein refolding chaperone